MGSEISEVINVLCEKLGTTGQYLIPELMKMNVAENVAMGIISLIATLLCLYFLLKVWKYDCKNNTYWIIFLIFIITVFGIFLIVCIVDTAGWLASPTAKAISYITNMIKIRTME